MPKKKNRRRNITPLKRYNKIVSTLVKDYKKRGVSYNISDVRKLASAVYPNLKGKAPSKITKRDVVKLSTDEVVIEAIDVPAYWFDAQSNFTYWFQVGEWANRFANAYPNIPVMIITKATEKTPLVIRGSTGDYNGSVFQKWTEDIRDELESPDESDAEVGIFFGTPSLMNKDGEMYATWFEDGVKLPKTPPKPSEVDTRKKVIIDKREEEEKKRREKEKPKKKRGRPKKTEEEKKKPLPKKKKKPIDKRKVERTPLRDKNKAKELLLEEFKLGLITKKEYREKSNKIENTYSTGGKL